MHVAQLILKPFKLLIYINPTLLLQLKLFFQIQFTSIVYYKSYSETNKITHIIKSVMFGSKVRYGNESENNE